MSIDGINTVEELIELCKNNESFLLTYFDSQGHTEHTSIKASVLVEILQIIQLFQQSQVKVEIDQEKLEELTSMSMQALAGSILSVEQEVASIEKQISKTS